MIAQMNVVQNAARMAMADHRAADPRFMSRRSAAREILPRGLLVAAAVAILAVGMALLG